jgi:hypothetical protein
MTELMKPVRRGNSRSGSNVNPATSASSHALSSANAAGISVHREGQSVQQFTIGGVSVQKAVTQNTTSISNVSKQVSEIYRNGEPKTRTADLPEPSTVKSSEDSQLAHASSRSPSSPYPELTLDTEVKEKTVDKWEAAAKLAEQRRMDHKKGLSRRLEVCDLLDMRDVQAVAENAQTITEHMREEEVRLAIPSNFIS